MKRKKELDLNHALCYNSFQLKGDSDEYLYGSGHPYGKTYRELRTFFDKLDYASTPYARVISYIDSEECCSYVSPFLGLRRLFEGRIKFTESNREVMFMSSKNNFKGDEPYCHHGEFRIKTRIKEFENYIISRGAWAINESFHITNPNKCLFKDIYKTVKKYHKGSIVGKRQILKYSKLIKEKEVDLKKKKICYADVSIAMITPAHIALPMVPFGPEGESVIHSNIQTLLDLTNLGFPWTKCRDYFKSNLLPSLYKELALGFKAVS